VYNGLIVSLRKPMSHGFEVLGNYTLSKSRDNGQQGGGNSGEGQVGINALNPFDTRAEWGNSGTDTRHRFTASAVWQPAFERNITTNVLKQVIGGWILASAITAQTGGHYTANVSSSSTPAATIVGFTPGSTTSTTFTYTPLLGNMAGTGINSPGQNVAGRIAWVPAGSFVLPNLYNVDLRLEKQFSIKERYHIALRGEAFNLFNTTLVQGVNQTAYNYTGPSSSTTATAGKTCPSTVSAGNGGNPTPHTNTCMVPQSTFKQVSTTSGNNLGARQLQAGIRFEF